MASTQLAQPAVLAPTPRRRRGHRPGWWVTGGIVLLAALCLASLVIGAQPVALSTIWESFTGYQPGNPGHDVIRLVRFPRTVCALIVGVSLGAAGAMMQAVSRNPLAEPGLLGMNAGAAVAVAAGVVWLRGASPVTTVLLAMVGAVLAGGVALVLGGAFRPVPNPVRLVLVGAALSTSLGAITSALVLTFPSVFRDFRNWDAGAVVHRPWSMVAIGGAVAAVALLLSLVAARTVDVLALGHDLGRAAGASPVLAWSLVGTAVVLLAAVATSLAGPISFIGLAAPLIARLSIGSRQAVVVPFSALLAAGLVLVADILGRVVLRPEEVPAAIIAAALGAPVLIAMARRGLRAVP